MTRESIVGAMAARLSSRNVVLGQSIFGSKKLADNICTEEMIRRSILVSHENRIYKIDGYEFQKELIEIFRDLNEYKTMASFVLTMLQEELERIERTKVDQSTSKDIWINTVTLEEPTFQDTAN